MNKFLLNEMKKIGIDKLPYSYSAFKNFIDKETMFIHYNKHYKNYVNKLNKELINSKNKNFDLEKIIKNINKYNNKVRNNAGGAFNHALFWKMLSPEKQSPSDQILKKIKENFKSFNNFKEKFSEMANNHFGSGWCWLILNKKNKLEIITTPNQDNPLMNIIDKGGYPLLGLDLWEHAYYLKYQNNKKNYIKNFWNYINWEFVNNLYISKQNLNENKKMKNYKLTEQQLKLIKNKFLIESDDDNEKPEGYYEPSRRRSFKGNLGGKDILSNQEKIKYNLPQNVEQVFSSNTELASYLKGLKNTNYDITLTANNGIKIIKNSNLQKRYKEITIYFNNDIININYILNNDVKKTKSIKNNDTKSMYDFLIDLQQSNVLKVNHVDSDKGLNIVQQKIKNIVKTRSSLFNFFQNKIKDNISINDYGGYFTLKYNGDFYELLHKEFHEVAFMVSVKNNQMIVDNQRIITLIYKKYIFNELEIVDVKKYKTSTEYLALDYAYQQILPNDYIEYTEEDKNEIFKLINDNSTQIINFIELKEKLFKKGFLKDNNLT